MIVVMAGLPGTGKSWLARQIAHALPHVTVLDRDAIRDAIFPPADLDYSDAQNELASQVTYQVAEYILARHADRIIILDGRPFSKAVQFEPVQRLAQRTGHRLKVILCHAPEAVVAQRLESDFVAADAQRRRAGRTMEKYYRIKRAFEPIALPHLSVDTSQPHAVARAIAYLTTYAESA